MLGGGGGERGAEEGFLGTFTALKRAIKDQLNMPVKRTAAVHGNSDWFALK